MHDLKIFITKPELLRAENFNPRNYDPIYLFVRSGLKDCPDLHTLLSSDIKSGSTPPYWFFKKKYDPKITPYVKTSAILRDFINMNNLHFIYSDYHKTKLKRSITHPYDVIFSMTGKFMGKAALCPPQLNELNMTQNSVVLKCKNPEEAAFLCIYLNSVINQTQIRGLYSITKQKYLNQKNIRGLKILEFAKDYHEDIQSYLDSIKSYYDAVISIQKIITKFNNLLEISEKKVDSKINFTIKLNQIDKRIITPVHYRRDFIDAVNKFKYDENESPFTVLNLQKGKEVGSKNYQSEGIPFIKTSDYVNFGVDYQPNYYCSIALYEELEQGLKKGDVLFTKDGKIGETAIIEESAKIVYSSGSVRLRPSSEDERYWIFLLLSSIYGRIMFERWTVIASTMAHLRKDFFKDFKIPFVEDNLKMEFINQLKNAFYQKKMVHKKIRESKKNILNKMYDIIKITI